MNHSYEVNNGVLLITLQGDLIGEASKAELVDIAANHIADNILLCAIDISQVGYINSSGIGILITILTKFRNKGGEVFIINPSDQVKKLLIITKLNSIFNIAETREDAVLQLINSPK